MKCKYCGSELSINDEACPFCGQKNEDAKPYTKTMKNYQKELKQATAKVEKTTMLVKNYMVFLIVAIVLLVLNVVFLVLKSKSYEITNWYEKKQLDKNVATYAQQIDEGLEDHKYNLVRSVYYDNNMYGARDYRGYSTTVDLATYFADIMKCTIYLTDENTTSLYQTKEETLDQLAKYIKLYYEEVDDLDSDYSISITTPKDTIQQKDILDTANRYLEYYLKLSTEQIDSLPNSSQTQIALLIGRSLGIYE